MRRTTRYALFKTLSFVFGVLGMAFLVQGSVVLGAVWVASASYMFIVTKQDEPHINLIHAIIRAEVTTEKMVTDDMEQSQVWDIYEKELIIELESLGLTNAKKIAKEVMDKKDEILKD